MTLRALDPERRLHGYTPRAPLALPPVVVSHELRFAHHVASSVLMMDEGRIVEEAPPDQFFSAPKEERTQRFLSLVE